MTGRDAEQALAAARRVADTVLYEGYVLFPYRASAQKNRFRWQFGVVVPEGQSAHLGEPAEIRSACLVRAGAGARLSLFARFLRLRHRQVEARDGEGFRPVDALDAGGELVTTWDEGLEEEVTCPPLDLDDLPVSRTQRFSFPASRAEVALGGQAPAGRAVRTCAQVDGDLQVHAERVDGDVLRLTTTLRNVTAWSDPAATRDEALRRSLVGAHLLVAARRATFASVVDPPEWAAPWTAALDNRHTHPVLAGARDDVLLSLPIILSDHPEIAPESPGDSFDATEIDELLALTTRALTDEERREALATDPRAAEIVQRAGALPAEVLERLHGAVRAMEPAPAADDERRAAIDEELAAFFGVDEDTPERVRVDGRDIGVGDVVRLAPRRRADAQDLFAAGRHARVARIDRDVEGATYFAVTLLEDPGADLHRWSSRYQYFSPEEVELVDDLGGEGK